MFRFSHLALLIGTAGVLGATPVLPLRFEANHGQSHPDARFVAHADGYSLLLTNRGAALVLTGSQRVDIDLLNSNPAAPIEPLDRLSARTDYFVGSRRNWHLDVPTYSRIRYGGVYPGIDLVYYGNAKQVEYDFVLQPGADPRAIRMKFRGARRLTISPEGDLVVETRHSRFVQKLPSIYQDGRPVSGRYVMLGHLTAGVRVGRYDRSRSLVIDPALSYLTYLGGGGTDQIRAMKLGANGLLYIAGSTDTQQLVGFGDSYNPLSAGLTDIFIAILDTNTAGFNLIYFSYLGGSALDIPLAIDVDAAGALYVTGTTTSTDFPIAGPAVQTTGAASTVDAFVLKLDFSKSGKDSLVYSTYLGGTDGSESGNGIAVGPDGMIYVIGETRSTDFPVTGGTAFLPVKWGLQDAFLSKIDPHGGLVYSTYMGGEGTEWGRAIAVGKTGLVYFAVSTLSQLYPAAGYSLNGTPHEFGQEVAVGVMDMTLSGIPSLLYSTFLGGSNNEEVRALALDARENIVVTGYTISTDFPITADAMQRQNLGNADLFVSVIDPKTGPAGLVYSTYLGGAHGDVPYDVKVDAAGSIYVTGYTLSSDFPVTPDGVQPQWGVGTNMFVAKLKPNVAGPDALQYGTFLGSSGTYVPQAIAVKTDGTIFVAGYASRGLPSSEIAFQPAFAGGASDGFVLVIGK